MVYPGTMKMTLISVSTGLLLPTASSTEPT
jgi:hypothetical protein